MGFGKGNFCLMPSNCRGRWLDIPSAVLRSEAPAAPQNVPSTRGGSQGAVPRLLSHCCRLILPLKKVNNRGNGEPLTWQFATLSGNGQADGAPRIPMVTSLSLLVRYFRIALQLSLV